MPASRDGPSAATFSPTTKPSSPPPRGPQGLLKEPSWRQGILRVRTRRGTHYAGRHGRGELAEGRVPAAGFEAYGRPTAAGLLARGSIDGVKDLAEVFPLRAFGDAVGIRGRAARRTC